MTRPGKTLEAAPSEMADTLFCRLRSLERRGASAECFRLILDDFLRREPAVAAALPEFSTFALLEKLRNAPRSDPVVTVGRYSAKPEEAIALMRRLSQEDVSLCYPWYNPNNPHFSTLLGFVGGLFFGIATPGSFGAAVSVGVLGGLFWFALASLVRYHFRNRSLVTERPQWICALHVDRYLQAHVRGYNLTDLRLEDLPNPGVRRKAPFYDLHNQIMAGPTWTYRPHLRETPELTFAPLAAPLHGP